MAKKNFPLKAYLCLGIALLLTSLFSGCAERRENPITEYRALMKQGDRSFSEDKYDEAITHFKSAKKIALAAGYTEGAVQSDASYAKTLGRKGDSEAALRVLQQSSVDCEADKECLEFEYPLLVSDLISLLIEQQLPNSESQMKDNRISELVDSIVNASSGFENNGSVLSALSNTAAELKKIGYNEEAEKLERVAADLR